MDDFTSEINNGVFIAKVNLTRATLKEVGEFNNMLSAAIKNGYKKIIVEMNEVEYIDSTFLGVLVVNLKKVLNDNGSLSLVGLKSSVLTIVEHTHLNKTFSIYMSREEAFKDI